MRSLASLKKEGAQLVRAWAHTEVSRTQILKDLARVVVGIRERFTDDDGETDWFGRTFAYREEVADMYQSANVPPDAISGVQSNIRYHIGKALRERLVELYGEEQAKEYLKSAGKREGAPVERAALRRKATAALAKTGAALAEDTGSPSHTVARLIKTADQLLGAVPDTDVADLSEDVARELLDTLDELEERAAKLRAALVPLVPGSTTPLPSPSRLAAARKRSKRQAV